eukprot:1182336-Prorocentrum_minimum.AAC.6
MEVGEVVLVGLAFRGQSEYGGSSSAQRGSGGGPSTQRGCPCTELYSRMAARASSVCNVPVPWTNPSPARGISLRSWDYQRRPSGLARVSKPRSRQQKRPRLSTLVSHSAHGISNIPSKYSAYIPCRKTGIGWPTVDSGA